jgi:hypothetical protein
VVNQLFHSAWRIVTGITKEVGEKFAGTMKKVARNTKTLGNTESTCGMTTLDMWVGLRR